MSQSGLDRVESARERQAERLASMTIPGKSNDDVLDALEAAPAVARAYQDDLNNWVRILDVRTRNDGKFGIPARYRWTLKRWAENDMDQWMLDHGWQDEAHLLADSRQHRPNELEARYKKKFGDWWVYTNIFVPVTDETFRKMNNGSPVRKAKRKRDKKQTREGIVMQKRLR